MIRCVKAALALVLCLCAITSSPVMAQTRPLDALVVINSNWLPVMNSTDVAALIGNTMQALSINGVTTRFIDTQSSSVTAVTALVDAMVGFSRVPDVLIVADETDITNTIQNAMRSNAATASVPIISAFASGVDVVNPVMRPNTISMMPSDSLYLRAVFDFATKVLSWNSVGVVYSGDTHGRDSMEALDSLLQNDEGISAPMVVSRAVMAVTNDDPKVDDEIIKSLLQYGSTAVICLVSDGMVERLRAAVARSTDDGAKDLFFLMGRNSLSQMEQLGSDDLWGIFMLPDYKRPNQWPRLITGQVTLDEPTAFVASYLVDAIQVVNSAVLSYPDIMLQGPLLLAALKSTSLTAGYTRRVAFDSSGKRVACSVVLRARFNDEALGGWSVTPMTLNNPVIDAPNKNLLLLIPASPLKVITVCMASTPSCPHVTNLNHFLFMIQRINITALNGTRIMPIPFNTGYDGVDGLRNMLPIASTCNFLVGPGRSSVTYALNPLINRYRIPQLDFTSSSRAFADKRRFPFFSRVVPSDDFSARATAAVTKHFGWERVVVLTTNDEYGHSVMDSIALAMAGETIVVEKIFRLDSLAVDDLTVALDDIRDNMISRIVVAAFAGSDRETFDFFDLIKQTGMNNTHVFLLSDGICQQTLAFPMVRQPLIGSICTAPFYNEQMFATLQAEYLAASEQLNAVLAKGGFDTSCRLSYDDPYSAFAFDAAILLVTAIQEAMGMNLETGTAASVNLANASAVTAIMRSRVVSGVTGEFTLNSQGDRTSAAFVYNIQQYNGVVSFAEWDSKQVPQFRVRTINETIRWMDNTTDVPADSTRSIQFIALQTVKQHPATIAISIIGFIGTIAVFVFCHRHYKLQKLLENTIGMSDQPGAGLPMPGSGTTTGTQQSPAALASRQPSSYPADGDTVELREVA